MPKKWLSIYHTLNSGFVGGIRTAAIAAELLKTGEIIALPTDTIYGIAGLAQNEQSISKLYEIKQRDSIKPLAICLSKPDEIVNWAHTQDLPKGLINAIITRTYYSNIKKKRQSK
uniref:Threonylcarbamoyl-AMP synthase n=1 Tax=Trichogramma kaykai TaxID=54128 RepID=A0ABD2WPS9_9HYME